MSSWAEHSGGDFNCMWLCGFVAVGNERNLSVRAYEPLCGGMERDVGSETVF